MKGNEIDPRVREILLCLEEENIAAGREFEEFCAVSQRARSTNDDSGRFDKSQQGQSYLSIKGQGPKKDTRRAERLLKSYAYSNLTRTHASSSLCIRSNVSRCFSTLTVLEVFPRNFI